MSFLRKIIDVLLRRRRGKRNNDASIYPMF